MTPSAIEAVFDAAKLATRLPPVAGRAGVDADRALQLLALLQTTLDVPRLIEVFVAECRRMVPFSSATYRQEPDDLDLVHGRAARHSLSYRLVLGEEVLGHLGFTRGKPFSALEATELENLMVSLVYPLRNALMYRRALHTALHDPLTHVSNRAALDVALKREVALARRTRTPLSLLLVDVDFFKVINDTYGHAIGDVVLKNLATCLQACVRGTDIVARFGGEEFAIVLPAAESKGAQQLADRIVKRVRKLRVDAKGTEFAFSVSVGVATLKGQESEASFFERADQALYAAKRAGRDRALPAG